MENLAFRQAETTQSSLPPRERLKQHLAIVRQRAKRPRREQPGVRTRVLLPRFGASLGGHCMPKLPRAGVPRRGHRRSRIPTRLQTGCNRRFGTPFQAQLGRLLTNFRQRVRKTRGKTPRVRTPMKLRKGAVRAQRAETGVSRTGHYRPECPTKLPTGWYRRLLTIFRAQLQRIYAFFRQRVKTNRGKKKVRVQYPVVLPGRDVPAKRHFRPNVLRPGVPGRGHCRPKIPTWGLNVLSHTPHSMWRCSSSPVLLFTVAGFVLCRGQRVILLRGPVHDGRKGKAFKDHRSVELIMPPPDPSRHKHIGRSVSNIDSAVWNKKRQNAVLFGTYGKLTQNPAMKYTFRALATSVYPKPALWTQCGAMLSRQRVSEPTINASGGGKILCEALSSLREAVREIETGSTHPASLVAFAIALRMQEPEKFRQRRGWGVNSGSRSQRSSTGVFDNIIGRAGPEKAVKVWRLLFASTRTLRWQNTAPVSSGVPWRWTTFHLPSKSRMSIKERSTRNDI